MKFLFANIVLLYAVMFNLFAFSQVMRSCEKSVISNAECGSPSVFIYEPDQSTAIFAPPSKYTTTSGPASDSAKIGKLQITYSVTLDARSNNSFTYDKNKWGVLVNPDSSDKKRYYSGSSDLPSNVTVSANPTNLSSIKDYYAGTVVITIDFTKANSILPSDFKLLTNGAITFKPLYLNGSSELISEKISWKSDLGAMLNPPSMKVIARDQAFVVNLSPPSSLDAVVVDTSTTPATLKATDEKNNLSGYIIVYWLDTDAKGNATGCKASPGNWKFQINPAALNGTNTTTYACTYSPYQSSFGIGGTTSAIGCATAGMTGILNLSTGGTLTPDNVAVPYTPSYSNPIQIPSDSNGTPSGCYNVVYIPNTQSSWSKGNIKNGEIYGLMAWALNYAYDDANKTIKPNYSLAHSKVSYATGIDISLASIDKSPHLTKTKDCFVVTAASGTPDSNAVFYWRILRDEYLTPIGFTKFYYKHAKSWANWVDEHPRIKPSLNFILELSGKALYKLSGMYKSAKEILSEIATKTQALFIQQAYAAELPASLQPLEEKAVQPQAAPETEKQQNIVETENKDQDKQQNIVETEENIPASNKINKNIIPPNYEPAPKKEMRDKSASYYLAKEAQPNYDFFVTGGILLPTEDKAYYDKYYSSQQTGHVEIGANYLWWFFDNLGLSLGLQGKYIFNKSTGKANFLGTEQEFDRQFYALIAEGVFGARFRHPNWTYLQPGLYFGVGVNRFREEESNSDVASEKPLGVTRYSPIFEIGGNLDVSLVPIFSIPPSALGVYLSDILLRFSAAYNINPTPSLATTGLFVQGGFVFLFE